MKTIKAKVHRLPTEQAEKCVTIAHKQMMLSPGLVTSGGDIQAFHLYITTDEEIKEGDFFYDTLADEIYTCGDKYVSFTNSLSYVNDNGRKIIATTDPKVETTNEVFHNTFKQVIPQIPQSFIEEYCKAGGIDEVLVEVVSCGTCLDQNRVIEGKIQIHKCTKCGYLNKHTKPNERGWDDDYCENLIPKLNPDNTIIIHPVEENKFEKQKTYILRRLEHCNKRLKQCEEKYNGKEEKHTFHGGRDLGYWQGLVEGYTLQLEWIEENL